MNLKKSCYVKSIDRQLFRDLVLIFVLDKHGDS